jgi:cytochrome d ubiquinol oxidase subunit II
MTLEIFWFCLIAVLWAGYFVLEGFDFGVGMLLPFAPRHERDREAMFESIGPVWDGNEVWLVVAAGATFAAFPAWYGTMFSGFYLALLLILCCLIIRVVSFEWRNKSSDPKWRATWQWANTIGSTGAPFLWGVALANLVHGVPLDSNGDLAGDFGDLFSAYTVFAGITVVLLFAFHGATFLALRTTGELLERVCLAARRLSLPAAVAGAVFAIWTVVVAIDRNDKDVFPPALPAGLAVAALALAVGFVLARRTVWAFGMTALAIVLQVATIFTSLYPRVLVSAPDFGNSLTVANASSAHYTLAVMTIVALTVTPIVLLYQGWTYHVFRARITGDEVASPGEALAPARGESAPGSTSN